MATHCLTAVSHSVGLSDAAGPASGKVSIMISTIIDRYLISPPKFMYLPELCGDKYDIKSQRILRCALPSKFLLFNELFQTELFDSVAYLSESYAQFLGGVRLNPIVALQRVQHLLPFSFTEGTKQLPVLRFQLFDAMH